MHCYFFLFHQVAKVCPIRLQRFVPSGCKGLFHQVAKGCPIRLQRFVPSGCKSLSHQVAKVCTLRLRRYWIRKLEFKPKDQFPLKFNWN